MSATPSFIIGKTAKDTLDGERVASRNIFHLNRRKLPAEKIRAEIVVSARTL
jgi:hypothetical protein